MPNAHILGSGSYAPKTVYPNNWFDQFFDPPVGSWLEENLQIYQRHWCDPEETTVDMAEQAAVNALQNCGMDAADLDMIILATDTPEVISPATSAALQHRLGAKQAAAFDINNACAGFINGLDIAAKYIQTDPDFSRIMVIGVYAISKYLNFRDKKTATIFGDGAGAMILGADTRKKGYLGGKLLTNGGYFDYLGIFGGGTRQPPAALKAGDLQAFLQVNQKFPEDINPNTWTQLIKELGPKTGIPPHSADHFFFTQINIQSIRQTLEGLEIPFERSHNIMDRFAYTGAACLPMAFHDAYDKGKIKSGDTLFLIGSGAGAAFGGAVFEM